MAETQELKRIYYGIVAVVGMSGTGKTYLTKTANRQTTGFIHPERKPLSYKAEPFKWEGKPKTWTGFLKNIKDYAENPEIENIIIDSQTEALDMLSKEMNNTYTGFDIYKFYNKEVRAYFDLIKGIEKDMIILSHDENIKVEDGTKGRRMFVHGKEFEGKIERQYTIVLFTGTKVKDGKPEYFLKTFEPDTSTKVPEGLFDGKMEIPNDAQFIFEKLKQYYSA